MALAAALVLCNIAKAQSAPEEVPWLVVVPQVNSVRKKELFVRQTPAGEILLRRADLPSLGLREAQWPMRTIDGEAFVALGAISGVQYRLEPSSLELQLLVPPQLLERTVIDAADRERQFERVGGNSGFVNWAVQHDSQPARQDWTFSSEAGLRLGAWLLQSSGHTRTDPEGGHRFVRLGSSALREDPLRQQRWIAGDFFYNAPELAAGANLGGVSVSRVFTLNPYLQHNPLNALTGQLLYPSEVDIYVNGQRVRSQHLQPGEFQINDLYLGQGARDVQLMARDPYGRVQQFSYSLYTSQQLLAPGTGEYQYALGAMRRNYGLRSNDYGPLAFSFFHRLGIHPALTLGLQGQARAGLVNAGTTGTIRLGRSAGILGLSLAASRADGRDGRAGALHYDYANQYWSAGAAWRYQSPGYAVLSDPRSLSTRRQTQSFYASRAWAGVGTLSFTHTRQTRYAPDRMPLPAGYVLDDPAPRRTDTLAFGAYLGSARSYLQLSLTRLADTRGVHTEVALGLTFFLDGRQVLSTSARQGGDLGGSSVQFSRTPPLGEGWGYELGIDQAGLGPDGPRQWWGDAQYNARQAVLRGEWRQLQGGADRRSLRLTASGGLAWVGGHAYPGRPVEGSFAVAQVGTLAGVPVRLNGAPLGETDAQGQLFIPSIGAFYEAELSLDPAHIPIEYTVPRLARRVVLPERTGATIDFEATRMRAILARLQPAAKDFALEGAPVRVQAGAREILTVAGREGELYLENLPAGHFRGTASAGGATCSFALEVPAGEQMFVEIGDLACR